METLDIPEMVQREKREIGIDTCFTLAYLLLTYFLHSSDHTILMCLSAGGAGFCTAKAIDRFRMFHWFRLVQTQDAVIEQLTRQVDQLSSIEMQIPNHKYPEKRN